MVGPIVKDYGDRWWKDWRWIAAIGFVLISVGFTLFVGTTILTNREVFNQKPILDELAQLASDNTKSIEAVQRAQRGVDELVSFIHDLERAQKEDGEDRIDLQVFVDLLCASSDPVRQEACIRLTATSPQGG